MKIKLNVGDVITVAWSNGHGESDYRVVDPVYGASHQFDLVADREFGDDDDGMDNDDYAAVFADIAARQAVRSGSAE